MRGTSHATKDYDPSFVLIRFRPSLKSAHTFHLVILTCGKVGMSIQRKGTIDLFVAFIEVTK
jgi:hypothetical protein